MISKEVRKKYIDFFVKEPRNHKKIESAPLILENDPSTLFTSAGMQPLVPYLLGESHPEGKRLVNSQPSIRLGDIEEVGDNRHTTFFEMLGNWSLGDYFKEEQLGWIFEFFTKELGLEEERLWVSVFEGTKNVPKDEESYKIWKKLGIPESRIFYYGAKENWWSMTGTPEEMNIGHIGGPDSEIFYDFGEDLKLHEKSDFRKQKCHPNCNCGRFLEIGNSVFIQYRKVSDTNLEELKQKNVDFGGGLERITAAVNNDPDIFKTDLFQGVISSCEELYGAKYGDSDLSDKSMRIIADHLRAAYMLISSDVLPSNRAHGYVLRRLIRRSVMHARLLAKDNGLKLPDVNFESFEIPVKLKDRETVNAVIQDEADKFFMALERGMKKLEKAVSENEKITGKFVFDLYQTDGFPLEISLEVLERHGKKFSAEDKKSFEKEFEKHKESSRTTSAGVFKGGLADTSSEVVKFHTATHILLSVLREIFGEEVVQKGQNITRDRSRFDFPFSRKLTQDEVVRIENSINKIIEDDFPVNFKIMPKEEAIKTGAIHAFNEKYSDTVKIYFVGDFFENAISREFCGGPHVKHTGEIGRVRIKKQEKIGANLVRIYLTAENG